MIIRFHKQFTKQLKKLSKKEQSFVKERLELFIVDQYHPRLRNHPLKGKYKGYRSIDIRPDLRAVFKELDKEAIFVELGSHGRLFK